MLDEIYPQLQEKLRDLVQMKEMNFKAPGSFKCQINFEIQQVEGELPKDYFEQTRKGSIMGQYKLSSARKPSAGKSTFFNNQNDDTRAVPESTNPQ